jgi:hypothetical protein
MIQKEKCLFLDPDRERKISLLASGATGRCTMTQPALRMRQNPTSVLFYMLIERLLEFSREGSGNHGVCLTIAMSDNALAVAAKAAVVKYTQYLARMRTIGTEFYVDTGQGVCIMI